MSLWYTETYNDNVRFGLRVVRSLYRQQSEFQLVEVFETAELGRALAIDGIYMTSEGDEFYYHEMLVHPALLTVANPRRVLIIGGGDGGTAREVLRHPGVESVVMVEIDAAVVEACKKHLPRHGAWDDPRLNVQIGDGIGYVKTATVEPFDVVLLDGTDPVGPAKGLFNQDFYLGVKRVLAPSGVFALQSESPILIRSVFLEIQRTLKTVFSGVHPYFGPVPIYAAGIWSWTFASDSVDPLAVDEQRLAAIESSCQYYNAQIHQGAFAVPNNVKRDLARAPA